MKFFLSWHSLNVLHGLHKVRIYFYPTKPLTAWLLLTEGLLSHQFSFHSFYKYTQACNKQLLISLLLPVLLLLPSSLFFFPLFPSWVESKSSLETHLKCYIPVILFLVLAVGYQIELTLPFLHACNILCPFYSSFNLFYLLNKLLILF